MKTLATIFIALFISATAIAQIPFNPDSNSDGIVNSGDLTSFLSVYGQSFFAEGVVPIVNGGTGAETLEAARDSLGISMFSDSLWFVGDENVEYAWVEGSFRATGNIATGSNTEATGISSTALGSSTIASGNFSHSQNRLTQALGICSHAEGEGGIASGTASHVEGFGCFSNNTGSHAEGYQTNATQFAAHAEGFQSTASGQYSHAENRGNTASGVSSHAEGQNNIASGLTAHAEGNFTVASGDRSHAGGYYTLADQENQTAVGQFNLSDQVGTLFVVGNGTSQEMRADAFKVLSNGNAELSGDLSVDGSIVVNDQDLVQTISDLQAENAALAQQLVDLEALVQQLIEGQ